MVKSKRDLRRNTVSKAETKTCPLCATLNYYENRQCLTCGWSGAFGNDPVVTDYHWQRLTERYEEVRLEHLVFSGAREIGELGVARKLTLRQRIRAVWVAVCVALQSRRTKKSPVSLPNSAVPPM